MSYLPATARMIAERAGHGTKVIRTAAIKRSRPCVTRAALTIAGARKPHESDAQAMRAP